MNIFEMTVSRYLVAKLKHSVYNIANAFISAYSHCSHDLSNSKKMNALYTC